MQKNIVPIVFCTDDKFSEYLPVPIQSILNNSSIEKKYKIFIFYTEDETQENIESFFFDTRTIIKNYRNVELKIININNSIENYCAELPLVGHITKAMYGRLFIAEILSELDKVIYADADILFNQDIARLIDVPLADNLIAGVPDIAHMFEQLTSPHMDRYVNNVLKLPKKHIYINSGLLVINTKLWREENIKDKILSFLRKNKILHLPDQDAINSLCQGRIVFLDQIWSYLMAHGFHLDKYNPRYVSEEYVSMLKNHQAAEKDPSATIHYTGSLKPWYYPQVKRGAEWWNVCRKTPVYEKLLARILPMMQSEEKFDHIKEYRFLFIPILKIRLTKGKTNYYLFSRLKVACKKDLLYRTRYYLLGINIITIKKR